MMLFFLQLRPCGLVYLIYLVSLALPFIFLFYKFIRIDPNQISGGIVGAPDCQNVASGKGLVSYSSFLM
jgi:hypothetical protein